jgi:hypothetical protein
LQAEVRRLTALVEDTSKKNRQLIAIGSKLSPFSGSAKFCDSAAFFTSLMLVVLL